MLIFQAVFRKVQEVGLQAAYNRSDPGTFNVSITIHYLILVGFNLKRHVWYIYQCVSFLITSFRFVANSWRCLCCRTATSPGSSEKSSPLSPTTLQALSHCRRMYRKHGSTDLCSVLLTGRFTTWTCAPTMTLRGGTTASITEQKEVRRLYYQYTAINTLI